MFYDIENGLCANKNIGLNPPQFALFLIPEIYVSNFSTVHFFSREYIPSNKSDMSERRGVNINAQV